MALCLKSLFFHRIICKIKNNKYLWTQYQTYTMKITITIVCFFLMTCHLYAQDQTSVENAKSYFKTVNNYASIYSGREEPAYSSKITNSPYLYIDGIRDRVDGFGVGILCSGGCIYYDVPMRLNQYIEELVVLSTDKKTKVMIPRGQFDYAIIETGQILMDSLYILFHKPVSADGKALPEGYYVRLHNGEYEVWIRTVSVIIEEIKDQYLNSSFRHNKRLYVVKDGSYHYVRNMNSLLKLFPQKKQEIKSLIKGKKLDFRKQPEATVVSAVSYYNELNK